MTDKQTDAKTYNCVYCNKTLTKFETQPLYKDGEFLTTCEECWYKHAKEAGHVVSDVQTINITIDDLINGNLRDMEFTAQFSVYKQAVKVLAEQLKAKEQECEKWKKETEQLQEELAISIQENEEGREINAELKDQNSCFKLLHESDKNLLKRKEQEYNELKKTIDEAKNSKLDLKSFLVGEAIQNEYEQQLNQLKAENEVLEKVNKVNQEKIKKLNEQLEEEFINRQYGDEALFFTLMDIKELAKHFTEKGLEPQSVEHQLKLRGKEELAKIILQKISEVLDEN